MEITLEDIKRLLSHEKDGVCRFAEYTAKQNRIYNLSQDDMDDAIAHAKLWMIKQMEAKTKFDSKLHIDMSVRMVIRNELYNRISYYESEKRKTDELINLGRFEDGEAFLEDNILERVENIDITYYEQIVDVVFRKLGYNARDILKLKFERDMPVTKIARKLDMNKSEVTNLYNKSIEYVREFIKTEQNRVFNTSSEIHRTEVRGKNNRRKITKSRKSSVPTDAFLLDVASRVHAI